jgi:hypothetical protein
MFHQHNVSYNTYNGMTFDGTLLNPVTGVHNSSELHTFSAPSKESLHMMLLAHVIQGNAGAVQWINAAHGGGSDVENAREMAVALLELKFKTYLEFNATYPGFGGFLPWYFFSHSQNIFYLRHDGRFAHANDAPLAPTWDWVNRVPALDNGENIWGIYAVISALESSGRHDYQALANKWQGYLDYLKTTMEKVSFLRFLLALHYINLGIFLLPGLLPRLRPHLRRD